MPRLKAATAKTPGRVEAAIPEGPSPASRALDDALVLACAVTGAAGGLVAIRNAAGWRPVAIVGDAANPLAEPGLLDTIGRTLKPGTPWPVQTPAPAGVGRPDDAMEILAAPLHGDKAIAGLVLLLRRGDAALGEAARVSLGCAIRLAQDAIAPALPVGPDTDWAGLFQAVPVPLWVLDRASWAFLDINAAACALFGRNRDTMLRLTLRDVLVPFNLGGQGLSGPMVERHRRADGVVFEIATATVSLRFRGRAARLVVGREPGGTATITHALGQSHPLLNAILEALPVGVFVKDMADDGRYVLYNAAVGELVGRDPPDVIGRLDHEVFGPDFGGGFVREDIEVMRSGRQMVIPAQAIVHATGETIWIRTVKKPLGNATDARPRYLLGIAENITDQRRAAERLAHLALHDGLTNLPNRTQFRERLEMALAETADGCRAAVLLLDLDLFKAVNDTFGHQAGDLLLSRVAQRFGKALSAGEMLARLGGDEFAVLMRAGHENDALRLGERLRDLLDEPFDLGDCSAQVDASVGIVLADPRGSTAEAMMRHADMALYQAKGQGRGLAHLYTAALSDAVERRHMMTHDLRVALKRGEFTLNYQPLYSLAAGVISGFEALLRWHHPERGPVSPAEFIPVAEQTGLIVPIGEWVLEEACREAATWPAPVRLAINLSPIQFRDASLVETIATALHRAGVAPSRLELEVTESVFLDGGTNAEMLHRLRALGIRIAIDDFGTGYSSLAYLQRFPVDKIKMDRSFVANVCHSPQSLAVVRAVIGLGSSLSITTTAEGIETPEQFARLRAEGFDEGQGFLIGRPMPASEALAAARSRGGLPPPKRPAVAADGAM